MSEFVKRKLFQRYSSYCFYLLNILKLHSAFYIQYSQHKLKNDSIRSNLVRTKKKHLCISNQSIWKIQLFKSTKLNKITFSEFTNEIKYCNGIPYHLQMEGINGFTECLIMRCYLILHIHTRMHIKNKYFSYLRIWR